MLSQFRKIFSSASATMTPSVSSAPKGKIEPNTLPNLLSVGAGCFWGTEKYFNREFKDALLWSLVGFQGGNTTNPSYDEVCNGRSMHAEVMIAQYDPAKVKYDELLDFFFRMHNATQLNHQMNDHGTQYRSVVFYYNDEQKAAIEAAIARAQPNWKSPIVTTIEPAGTFYPAEDYHQAYLEKNPGGYCSHRIYYGPPLKK